MVAALNALYDARDYLRVSKNKWKRERSNEEQHGENRDTWPDWEFGPSYSDVGSASGFARRERDDWPLLLDDLRTGSFAARHLVLWEGSRGSRKVGEWVDLLDLCAQAGVSIAVTELERVFNPSHHQDRFDLIAIANAAELESGKTSSRIKRNMRSSATKGRPHGKIPFGYRRIYDPETRELVDQQIDPVEGPVVERIFTERAAGKPINQITAGLNEDGIKTRNGKPWYDGAVWFMLRRPTYRGIRTHHGRETKQGAWPAIIDQETWDLVQSRWPKEGWRAPPTSKPQLLTGIARCGVCTGRMRAWFGRERRTYACIESQCAARNVERLDRYVTKALLRRLMRVDRREVPGKDPALVEAEARVDELKAELAEAKALMRGEVPGKPKLSPTSFAEHEAWLLPQITEAERAVRRMRVRDEIVLPPAEQIPEWWVGLSVRERRDVVSGWIVAVTVTPVGKGRRSYDDKDFTAIEWRR